ncbi:MAG: hypothetical protein OXI15_07135 [Chromatiales bacterium]|nr:hypothetical protein [Chromatiales bacterium]
MYSYRLRSIAVAALVAAMVAPEVARAAPDRAERAAILAPTSQFDAPERWERLSGGSATNRKRFDRDAFSLPSANMPFEARAQFAIGNGLFRRPWVSSPSSTRSADGLGPLYNARSCQRCHLKDGRGHPPANAEDSAVSMLVRLSIPPRTEEERTLLSSGRAAVIPESTYGGQLQDVAVPGMAAEGRIRITRTEREVLFDDGTKAVLEEPRYAIVDMGYGPLDPSVMTSPRVAPPMIGLGLLEAVAASDILARADPDDADGDGISGRARRVWSRENGRMMLGRFGWKAGAASIVDQSADAMSGDIGVSSPLAPEPWGECTARQRACRLGPHGADAGEFEAPAAVMDAIVFYSRHLAVPARRGADDPAVLRGKALFYRIGCTGCHTPKHATRRDWPVEELAGQLIWPYTDLLVHDMGERLADGRPEGDASGREWRTAPLWGVGLTEVVNGHTRFLHDGRARNLVEAILWHGGEAEAATAAFRSMPRPDRDALVAFLNSL